MGWITDEDKVANWDLTKWDAIVELMDDGARESVHQLYAPCSKEIFLEQYLKFDPYFATVLDHEFRR